MTASPEIRIAETAEEAVSVAVGEWRTALEDGTPERPRRALLAGGSRRRASIAPRSGARAGAARDAGDRSSMLLRRRAVASAARTTPTPTKAWCGGLSSSRSGTTRPACIELRGRGRRPERAAREYEALLRERFQTPPPAVPSFDLALQGWAEDGHTASLFPG
jgi:hypothetical protein